MPRKWHSTHFGLNSPYAIKDEFQRMVQNFNTEFASLNPVEKQRYSWWKTHTKTSRDIKLESWLSPLHNKMLNGYYFLLQHEQSVVSTDSASFQQQLLCTENMQASAVDSLTISFQVLIFKMLLKMKIKMWWWLWFWKVRNLVHGTS